MKRVTRKGLIAAAAVTGAAAVTMPAYADSAADGGTAGSPGLISGNTIQLPVHVPVNVCGNTVNVAGLLNPAAGNTCANSGGGGTRHGGTGHSGSRGGTAAGGGATARGGAEDSPGVLSGNGLQLPVRLPVNVSGNSVNVVGIGDAATGNESTNTSTPGTHPHHPGTPTPKPRPPKRHTPAKPVRPVAAPPAASSLAHTGAGQTLPAVAGSAALLLGGAVLYRRFRPVRHTQPTR